MYKIYINGRPLVLATLPKEGFQPSSNPENLITIYTGNPKSLLGYVDMLEKNEAFKQVTIYGNDGERLFKEFSTQFTILEAAGGLVFNTEGQGLFIYRLETWDLPKGKIDPGETPEAAAVREVQEETGLQEVKCGDLLLMTYHTYRHLKKGRILKPTYWYRMTTPEAQLTPQAEENIEKAEWKSVPDFLESNLPVYPNIRLVLKKGLE
ncbi:MAG: NUDIX domain-containing protein [Phaeodactylibacter sp.]|uniref:NUDIX hydrolase n=1 Tax=Phaeodactylibacter sp. TaxID=1940289 RepID=UPI0032F09CC1